MILLPCAVRVYFATAPTNLRKSLDGLTNEIRHALGHDPRGGHVFVFLNRRKNQVKLIVWTRGGWTIVHKRLGGDLHVSGAGDTGRAQSAAGCSSTRWIRSCSRSAWFTRLLRRP